MMRRWVVTALAAALAAAPAWAQGSGPAAGSVSGTVLAAETGQPLPGALVVLEAAGDAVLVTPAAGSFYGRSLTATTDGAGAYRFRNVTPGSYRLHVRHLGFKPARLEVQLGRAESFRVSVGLVVRPILLETIDVGSTALEAYGRLRPAAEDAVVTRLDAERFRRDAGLEGDARVLTHGEVVEAVTLGEPDLLRALQRLPGVATRDDFTASLWVRGAPWSLTRVTFDGLPLFNPVHALGLLGGIGPDAVGLASFHPGVRPAAMGEGAAGVLNVESRPAGPPGWRGLAELSVASARAAVDARTRDGRAGVMLSARRSHVDLVSRLIATLNGDSTAYVPYAFYDVAGRFDLALGTLTSLEVSGLWEQDQLRGQVRDLIRETRGAWGNVAGRATLSHPLGRLQARHSVGVSRFSGDVAPMGELPSASDVPSHAALDNRVTVLELGTEIAPRSAMLRPRWALGWQAMRQLQRYQGQFPREYPVAVLPQELTLDEALSALAVWGERRFSLATSLAVTTGLRLELPSRARNVPPLAAAPRLHLRWTPGGGALAFSAGAGRSWQYTQALAPAGPSVGPDLYLTDVWLLANDTIPAVRADVATASVELALGSWVAVATLWGRRMTGVAVPEPAPGQLNAQRPIFASAEGRARGLELSARRLAGRWTGSVAYTWSRSDLVTPSTITGARYRYPSAADRRHVVDATVLARVTGGLRAGAAFTAASGAPFSRFILGLAGCDPTQPGCTPDTIALRIEQPGGARTAPYAALDLLLEWSRASRRGVTLGAWLQLRNALGADNAVTYTGTLEGCADPRPPTLIGARPYVCDRFDRGIGLLPLAGVRVSF